MCPLLHVLGSASDTRKSQSKNDGPSQCKTGAVSSDQAKVTPHVAYSDIHEPSAIDRVNLPSVDVRTL